MQDAKTAPKLTIPPTIPNDIVENPVLLLISVLQEISQSVSVIADYCEERGVSEGFFKVEQPDEKNEQS